MLQEEYIKGLVKTVNEKLAKDIPFYVQNKDLLYHAVNEALAFDKALRTVHNFQNEDSLANELRLTCVQVFAESKEASEVWLELESDCKFFVYCSESKLDAAKQFNKLLSDPDAWSIKYTEIPESDDYKQSHFADGLVILLNNITG